MSEFNRGNIDHYLYMVAREYKKRNRTAENIEILVAGGAAVLLNYNFRESTVDIDVATRITSSLKDAVNKVGEDCDLPSGWLNSDCIMTKSYSPVINQYSRFYKRFCNVMDVRTVSSEYMVAMKIRARRSYKHDLSDIIGIVMEQMERNEPLSLEKVTEAYHNLYSEDIETEDVLLLEKIFSTDDLETYYYDMCDMEVINKEALSAAVDAYGSAVSDDNADDFINAFKR